MCGIHFVINAGTKQKNLDDFISDAFLANQVRGTDSSGVFVVEGYKPKEDLRGVHYFKKAMHGSDFLQTQSARTLIGQANNNVVTVGHVRASTWGSTVDKNAHPFVTVRADGSRIIGVHNGSLEGWHTKEGADEHDVDSAWLYSKIAEDGFDAFEGIQGAFTLVWYDSTSPDRLFIARNDKRPLYYAYTEDQKGIIGCSELGMLGWLASRRDIKLHTNKEGFKFLFPEPGFVHSISITDPTDVVKTKFKDFSYSAAKYVKKPAPQPPQKHTQMTHWRDDTVPRQRSQEQDRVWTEYDLRKQARMLSDIKQALASGRSKRYGTKLAETPAPEVESPVVTDEHFEDQLYKEIQTHLRNKHGMLEEVASGPVGPVLQFAYAPNVTHVLQAEVARAKSIGLFGAVVNFCGYMYDDETGEVYGDFEVREKNGKVEKYDALVRGQSTQSANAIYISPSKLTEMEVVGIMDTVGSEGTPFVVLADKSSSQRYTTPWYSGDSQHPNRMLH